MDITPKASLSCLLAVKVGLYEKPEIIALRSIKRLGKGDALFPSLLTTCSFTLGVCTLRVPLTIRFPFHLACAFFPLICHSVPLARDPKPKAVSPKALDPKPRQAECEPRSMILDLPHVIRAPGCPYRAPYVKD